MSNEYLNLAMVQIASSSNHKNPKARKEENFLIMEEYIDSIALSNPAVNMIVFPEFYLNGLLKNKKEYQEMAETIPGPLTEKLSKKAKEHKIWLVPGSFIEKHESDKEKTYNSAILISPDGEIVRSEEHTSELQSRGHLVCRLLLEKKNKTIATDTPR